MFNFLLYGGKGNKVAADVTEDQELRVIAAAYPALGVQKVRPFRQYFTTDGTAAGSNDMGVDGSVTNVDFYIPAARDVDRYISSISIILSYGTTGQPNEWADGTALTNGCRLFYSSLAGEVDIHDAIKNNQDMFRLNSNPIDANWEVRHVGALNDYGYFIVFNIQNLGIDHGIKLDRDTNQRLTLRVRDNVGTDADTFNIIAYGFDRFK